MIKLLKIIPLSSIIIPSVGMTGEMYTELNCLAANVFMEARGESLKGRQAVADVVLNRTKHSAFKGQYTVCKVVLAPSQFSWIKGNNKQARKLLQGDLTGFKAQDKASYWEAQLIAGEALVEGYKPLLPSHVISFHTVAITPHWADKMKFYATIGNHRFYSFKRKGSK